MRRAQPVLRRQGDLHGRAGPEVLVRRGRDGEGRVVMRVGAWGPLAKAAEALEDSLGPVVAPRASPPTPSARGSRSRRG